MNPEIDSGAGPRARMVIAVYPLGTDGASVSREVSAIFGILDNCGLTYEITVMGTIVEGAPAELFTLAARLHECMFSDRVRRVVTSIRIDDRRNG